MPNATLAAQIQAEALAQGVPPAIALAVAQKESGIFQYTSSGQLVTGSSGEIGVFQLMPATAASLGVDPANVDENISGGIGLLAQLFNKYGNWSQALSAYNSGSPNGSPSYASSVLAAAGSPPSLPPATGLDLSADDAGDGAVIDASAAPMSPVLIGGIIVAGVALAWWVLD